MGGTFFVESTTHFIKAPTQLQQNCLTLCPVGYFYSKLVLDVTELTSFYFFKLKSNTSRGNALLTKIR